LTSTASLRQQNDRLTVILAEILAVGKQEISSVNELYRVLETAR
jgi:hypothetical protein